MKKQINFSTLQRLDLVDANDLQELLYTIIEELVQGQFQSGQYSIANVNNQIDAIKRNSAHGCLNPVVYLGIDQNESRLNIVKPFAVIERNFGELITFTSGAGMGKSSIMRELMHHLLKNTKHNIGILALEESIKNTAFNIMSVEANARLYIKEIRDKFSREQLQDYQKNTVGSGRFFAFDHFGSIENDEILDRVRYMAKALDCKWVFLDHLSILVSGQEDNGDERKSIDILMTKLRSLVEETNIGLLLVSHLRRPGGDRGHEDGREVSLSHLRGSASIAHLSDAVIGLERNQQAEDDVEANTTTVRILKNR